MLVNWRSGPPVAGGKLNPPDDLAGAHASVVSLTGASSREKDPVTTGEARHRIQSAIDQFGAHAGTAIDLVINEVRSSQGNETADVLIDEFDLELHYNIAPSEPEGSGD
jgi:hypothetical protein